MGHRLVTSRPTRSGRHSPAPAHRWALAGWLASWLLLTWLTWSRAALPEVETPWHAFSFMDYRDTMWVPVRDFLHGDIPWDTQSYLARHPASQEYLAYLPSYWWFALPLLLLPYHAGVVVWLGITTGAITWLCLRSLQVLAAAHLARRPWLVLLLNVFVVATRPGKTALSLGQWATLCAVGASLALLQVPGRPGRWPVVGTALALVKPPVGLPLLGLQLITRRAATALFGLAVSLLLSLPILLVVVHRAHGITPAARIMLDNLANRNGRTAHADATGPTTRVDVLALLHNAHIHLPGSVKLMVLAAAALVLAWAYRTAVRRHGVLHPVSVTLGSLALVLVTPNIMYCLLALVPALVALCAYLVPGVAARDKVFALVSLLGMLVPFMLPGRLAAGFTGGLVNCVALVVAAASACVWGFVPGRLPHDSTRPGSRLPGAGPN